MSMRSKQLTADRTFSTCLRLSKKALVQASVEDSTWCSVILIHPDPAIRMTENIWTVDQIVNMEALTQHRRGMTSFSEALHLPHENNL